MAKNLPNIDLFLLNFFFQFNRKFEVTMRTLEQSKKELEERRKKFEEEKNQFETQYPDGLNNSRSSSRSSLQK